MSPQRQSVETGPRGLIALALGISAAVTRGGELRAMLRSCVYEFGRHIAHIERARIWVRAGDFLELCASSDSTEPSERRIAIGEPIAGSIAASGTPYLSGADAPFAGYPLLVEDRVVGVLELFAYRPIRRRALAVVEPMAAIIAQAIERKRVESELRASIRLHDDVENRLAIIADASRVLLESLELPAVLERVVEVARRVLAADAYAVWRTDGAGQWRMLLSTGLSEAYQRTGFIGFSSGSAAVTDRPLIAEDVDALPLVENRREAYRAEGIRSFIAFPLRLHGQNSATLTLYFRSAQQFRPEDVRIGSALANLAAAAIASAETYEDQRRLREDAQEQTRRISFIAEASKLLVTTLDFEHTLRAVASLAIPVFADWCAVDILSADGNIHRLATVHADPARVALAEEYYRKFPEARGVQDAISGNRSLLAPDLSDEVLQQTVNDPERLRMLCELRLKSVMVVPMAARDRVLGAITFVTAESGRRYGPEDLAAAEHVARRAALAIDNALLFRAAQERQDEANRALQALAASHDRLQQFAYAASHDLREPLRTITAYLQLIDRRLADQLQDETRENFAFVTGAAARMTQLLNDLLDYVRTGDGTALRASFSLGDAAARAIENLRLTISESGAEVRAGDLPVVLGDELQFVRLFQNLISNAIKYRSGAPPLVEIRSERRGDSWAVAVQDNGVGIAPEHQQKIFGVFKRLHGMDVPGTGIGLAIARAVVENHGGKLWVESEPGCGSTFWFTLPAQEQD